jgi:hypothetical protein
VVRIVAGLRWAAIRPLFRSPMRSGRTSIDAWTRWRLEKEGPVGLSWDDAIGQIRSPTQVTPFVLRRDAVSDLRQALYRYETERDGLGEDFLQEVRRTVDVVTNFPFAYPIVHRDTRRSRAP